MLEFRVRTYANFFWVIVCVRMIWILDIFEVANDEKLKAMIFTSSSLCLTNFIFVGSVM